MTSDSPAAPEPTASEPECAPVGSRRAARAYVIAFVVWVAGFGAWGLSKALSPVPGAVVVESPFKAWDGKWAGEFVVSKEKTGEVVRRLKVEQRYRHVLAKERRDYRVTEENGRPRGRFVKVGSFEQEGHFRIEDPATGEVQHEKALNSSDIEMKDLRCKVVKDRGREIVEHTGRIENGKLVWSRDVPGVARETFVEWIEGDVYFIEGTGVYGDPATAEPLILRGRYERVRD